MSRTIACALAALWALCGCHDHCRPECLFVAPSSTNTVWKYSAPFSISRAVEQRYGVYADCHQWRAEPQLWDFSTEDEAWRKVCSEPYNVCSVTQEAVNAKCNAARESH